MAKVVIFGLSQNAVLAHFYLTNDSEHEVVAFSVNQEFATVSKLSGLPVIPFETIEEIFPPEDFKFFAPLSPRNMNKDREKVFEAIQVKGYSCVSYISSYSTCLTKHVGENCFILEDNTIQPFTKIGQNVMIWSGNHIGHHSSIENHVALTSHSVISGNCTIRPLCFIGINSSIKNGVTLAEGTYITMSTSVTADTDPWSVYRGNPAQKLKIPSTRMRW